MITQENQEAIQPCRFLSITRNDLWCTVHTQFARWYQTPRVGIADCPWPAPICGVYLVKG